MFHQKHFSSFQIITLGFAGVILLGSLFLMLPFSTQSREVTSFPDALFTAVSAVCVTGLVVRDTGTYWSTFGQSVILILIQVGGLGVVTTAVVIAAVSGRKIGLMQRSSLQDSISAPQLGGILKTTAFIVRTTIVLECLGAAALMFVFLPEFGFKKGIWFSVFHSVSAFCNAGFDLMGIHQRFSSLTLLKDNPVINLTICLLIIIGGIGFLTWEDLAARRFRINKYRMQTKTILTVTMFMILLPAIYFFFFEYKEDTLFNRLWYSFFQSVTPRTAGFNTTDLLLFSDVGITIMIFLMLTGGAPGSTAGGMKVTTLAVLLTSAKTVFQRKEYPVLFKRRVSERTILDAAAILLMYLTLFFSTGMLISIIEKLPLKLCLFETASAIGTVGLTLGITPELSQVSRLLLIGLMFFGRIGGLTIFYAAVTSPRSTGMLPEEKIAVG